MDNVANNTEHAQSKKTGRIVLFALIGFFIIFATVDAFFVYKALSTNTGLVAENPYERGLRFNEVIAEAQKKKNASNGAEK